MLKCIGIAHMNRAAIEACLAPFTSSPHFIQKRVVDHPKMSVIVIPMSIGLLAAFL